MATSLRGKCPPRTTRSRQVTLSQITRFAGFRLLLVTGPPGDASGRGKKHTGVHLWTHRGGTVPVLHSRAQCRGASPRLRLPPLYLRSRLIPDFLFRQGGKHAPSSPPNLPGSLRRRRTRGRRRRPRLSLRILSAHTRMSSPAPPPAATKDPTTGRKRAGAPCQHPNTPPFAANAAHNAHGLAQ